MTEASNSFATKWSERGKIIKEEGGGDSAIPSGGRGKVGDSEGGQVSIIGVLS